MSQTNYTKKFKKLVKGTTMLSAAIAVMATQNTANAQELPPADAKAGECYAKVLIPAVYQTAPTEVVVQPASNEVKEVPAEYKDVQKQVLVEEESFELEIIPAQYEVQQVRVRKSMLLRVKSCVV